MCSMILGTIALEIYCVCTKTLAHEKCELKQQKITKYSTHRPRNYLLIICVPSLLFYVSFSLLLPLHRYVLQINRMCHGVMMRIKKKHSTTRTRTRNGECSKTKTEKFARNEHQPGSICQKNGKFFTQCRIDPNFILQMTDLDGATLHQSKLVKFLISIDFEHHCAQYTKNEPG